MIDVGKALVWLGLAIVVVGAILWSLGRFGFRGLPGDIRYESDNVRIYFPIVTCLVLSVLFTLLHWLWQWFQRP